MRRSIGIVLGLALAGVPPLAAQPGAAFSFPERSGFVVIEYRQILPMLEESDPEPLLRVHGDGTVRVHQPRWRVDAGDYELRLSPGELRQLVRTLVESNVTSADTGEIARARRLEEERRRSAGELFAISDATVTQITLRLERFTPAPGARAIADLERQVVWPNLQSDAERFPELPAIAPLAAAERALQVLLDRPDLRRIP